MPLEKYIVLPTAHAQQNFAKQRYVMPVFGVDRDLRRSTDRNVVTRNIVLNIDNSKRPAPFGARSVIDQRSRRLYLAGGNSVENDPHLAFEHAPRHSVEGHLRLVAGPNPL